MDELQTAMVNLPRQPGQEPVKITRPQWEAIKQRFTVNPDGAESFEQFCWRVQPSHMMGCLMMPWCTMWLGSETDGHTHS
jgi:flavin reductase (DIM6/NTAB) family NADH-FMN oxidoreductase RutF